MGKQHLFGFRVGLAVVDGLFHRLRDVGFHQIPVLEGLDGDSRDIGGRHERARDKVLSSAARFRAEQRCSKF